MRRVPLDVSDLARTDDSFLCADPLLRLPGKDVNDLVPPRVLVEIVSLPRRECP